MDHDQSSAEDLPLQPYFSDRSLSSTNPSAPLPRPIRTRPIYDDVELQFLRVAGRNRLPVVQPADIQLEFPDSQTVTRSGLTMQVHRGLWRGRRVALKRIRRHLFDSREYSEAGSQRDYEKAMYDLNFELQIMSKKSLCDHRNITKLLAVSFDTTWVNDVDSMNGLVLPVLIVELADNRYPDLSLFLNAQHNPDLPNRLPFETAASLISDIADGVEALHNHDIVHADLKPANILIFSDHEAPCGLVAKIADFGFSGMATYNNSGQRAWLPGSRPRGGTAEWNAPECIQQLTVGLAPKELPPDMPSRDIYSFGLLSSYIALDGQTPTSYVKNLPDVKLSDGMAEAVKTRLKEYHSQTLSDDRSLGNLVAQITDMTLTLDREKRKTNLGDIRQFLFGSNLYEKEHPRPTPFVLNFNLFPNTLHEFRHDGLLAAYWLSPPAFRDRVFDSFRRHSSGIFGQYVAPEIWTCLQVEGNDITPTCSLLPP